MRGEGPYTSARVLAHCLLAAKPDLAYPAAMTGPRIGSLQIPGDAWLAPMAGFANLPFRRLCREHGCDFVTSELISAVGLVRGGHEGHELLADHPADRPRAVQLFGADPALMAEAARQIEENGLADAIDINMGCPVRKVVGTGAGAALLREPDRAAAIVAAVRESTRLPLMAKLRAGWDHASVCAPELARRLADAGLDAVCLHPRTRAQGYSGQADWSLVARTVRAVSIPVIGSGDVTAPEHVQQRRRETGCAAIQVGRAALGNPLLFARWPETDNAPPRVNWTPPPTARGAALRRHVELYREFVGEARAAREMRKHIGFYFRGLPGAARCRAEAQQTESCEALLAIADRLFQRQDAD